jgi:hypothetical protein
MLMGIRLLRCFSFVCCCHGSPLLHISFHAPMITQLKRCLRTGTSTYMEEIQYFQFCWKENTNVYKRYLNKKERTSSDFDLVITFSVHVGNSKASAI